MEIEKKRKVEASKCKNLNQSCMAINYNFIEQAMHINSGNGSMQTLFEAMFCIVNYTVGFIYYKTPNRVHFCLLKISPAM